DLEPPLGILEKLNEEAKGFKESMEKATSVERLRHFQHELERVQLRIHSILNPSEPPEPIQIPIEFNDNILFDEIQEFQRKFEIALPVTIDPDFTRLLESINAIVPTEGIVIPVKVDFAEGEREKSEEEMAKIVEGINQARDAAAQTFLDIQSLIANTVQAAIQGEQTFAQALAGITLDIVDTFLKQALAAAITKAITTPGAPLPVGLALAGIAVAAVKGLFTKNVGRGIGGSIGGSSYSAFASERADPTVSTVEVAVTVRIEGNDILISGSRARDRNNFTRPGG